MYENIVWSAQSCTLKTFVERYPLPQLVQVGDGIYSNEEAKTLSAGQILTLHYTKRTDKVLAKAAERKPFLIPVNLPCKVEILPTICEDRYYSVHDVVNASSVKFIRVVHDGPPYGLKAGNILKLRKTVEENRRKYIECEFHDKTRDLVKIPLDFKAAFDPLDCAEQYHFQEVLNSFKLPVRVKFISSDTTIQDVNSEIDLLSLGSVLLKSIREESTIIATSRAGKTVTVVMIFSDLDVSVYPAQGAITGDETYARFCRKIHDGADLEKVDLSLVNGLRWGDKHDVEFLYDYVEIKPPVPTRRSRSSQPDSDDSQDDYEKVPPVRPPKPRHLTTPPTSQTHTTSQQPQCQYVNLPNNATGQAPPPPLRTSSLQQDNSKTANHGADTSHERKRSYNDDNEHSSSDQEYLSPVENHMKTPPPVPPKRSPSTYPKPKPPLKQDREPDKVFKDDETTSSGSHYQLPRSPVQAVSGQRSDENASIIPFRTGRPTKPTSKSVDSDTLEEDDYIGDNDLDFSDLDSDFSSSSSQEYIYPEVQYSENTPQAQANLNFLKRGKKRISAVFKKVTLKSAPSKSKSVTSQGTSAASVSDKTPISSSPTATDQNHSSSDFPDDLKCLSVTEVGECLRKLKMEKHVDTFHSNQIDGQLFIALDEKSLTDLDVNEFEQKKLMKFIHGWRPKTN